MKFILTTIICLVVNLFLAFYLVAPLLSVSSATVSFLYDGDGARVAKIEEGKTTVYVGDMEKNVTTGEVTRYYSIGGKRVAVRDSSGLNYIVSEHLGSLTTLIDSTGKSKADIRYYPYGTVRVKTGTALASRQYTSQINDDSTGLYFYNARYYNPVNANFIQADTNNAFPNRYFYAVNNPVRLIDPTGHDPEDSSGVPQLPVIIQSGDEENQCGASCLMFNGFLGFLEMGSELKDIVDDYMSSGFEERKAMWEEVRRIQELGPDAYSSNWEYQNAIIKATEPLMMGFFMGSTGGISTNPNGWIRLFHGGRDIHLDSIMKEGIRTSSGLNPTFSTDISDSVAYAGAKGTFFINGKVVTQIRGVIYDLMVPRKMVNEVVGTGTSHWFTGSKLAPISPSNSSLRVIPPQYIQNIYLLDFNNNFAYWASRTNGFKWTPYK